jgi:DNA-binding transcriptional LysR family regulator
MEFHQLTYFLAAAQTQNFRKAAELCLVAQSALSRQVAALENELEVALFTRNKKRVTLTPAGQEFAFYVRNAMEQLQEGQQFLAELHDGQRGTIRLGCIESLATAFLPALFASFHQQYPHIQLKVRVNHTDELITLVEENVSCSSSPLCFGIKRTRSPWITCQVAPDSPFLYHLHQVYHEKRSKLALISSAFSLYHPCQAAFLLY